MAYVLGRRKPNLTFPTQTGSIVTFNSQYAGLPLKVCKVNIPVTQEGTGDPSPDNVRNFVGYSEINIYHPNNLIDFSKCVKGFIYTDGGLVRPTSRMEWTTEHINVTPNGRIVWWADIVASDRQWVAFSYFDSNGDFITRHAEYFDTQIYTKIDTVPNDAVTVRVSWRNYSDDNFSNRYLFFASQGLTSISFGKKIYAGELDVLTGVFTADVYSLNDFSTIRIYNGTTLTNTQTFYLFLEDVQRQADLFILSNIFKLKALSNDEPYCVEISQSTSLKQRIYVSFPVGTTAEQAREYLTNNNVIFLIHLAEPEVINLGGMEIATLQGENNLFASTGETTAEYIKIGG